ncbi:MAG: hypothetical protein M0Z67_04320 [Nitrospiraceae bacterium]|nr:hypothetical protein [Nitrospiraceae bacterium]
MSTKTSQKKKPGEIPGKESWRNLSITKICDTCKKEYHPRKNGYEATSRFCSAECTKKGRHKNHRF